MSLYRGSGVQLEDAQWITQLNEINARINKAEKTVKEQKMRELHDAYAAKLQEEQNAGEMARRKKEADMAEMARRRQMYEEERARQANEELNRKNELANLYKAKMDEKKQLEQEKRNREMDDANRRNEMQRRAQELERRIQQEKMDAYNRAQMEDMQRREEEKRRKRDNDHRAREEYREQIAWNAEKEVKKEENYRNYFKKCSEVQEKLQNMHNERVFATSQERQKNLEEFVKKNEEEYTRKAMEADSAKLRKRQQDRELTTLVLKEQMRSKEEYKMLGKMGSADAIHNPVDHTAMTQLERIMKKDEQRVYKDILDKQREGKTLALQKSQTMSPNQGIYLIPGFTSSKYIHPYSPEARYADIIDYKVKSEKLAAVTTPGDVSPNMSKPLEVKSPTTITRNGSYLASIANNNLIG